MSDKLRPCPFCGSKFIDKKPMRPLGETKILFLKCGNPRCGVVVSFDNDVCNADHVKTIEYWNRRVNDDIK